MGLDLLDGMFREEILDHSRNPLNQRKLDEADVTAYGVNPFCGDELHLQVRLDEQGRIQEVGLQGVGCSINKATGSMLTQLIRGKTLDDIEALSNVFSKMMQGDSASEAELKELGELEVLSDVRRFPVRIKCALLAWDTLADGIEDYRRDRHG